MKSARALLFFTFAAAWILTALPMAAHHSTAEYDMTATTSVKGTVTKFEWANPHAYIYLDAKDDKGNTVQWSVEAASVGMLARVNWKRDSIKPGDEITVYGNRAKDGRAILRLDKVVFASGQELSSRVL